MSNMSFENLISTLVVNKLRGIISLEKNNFEEIRLLANELNESHQRIIKASKYARKRYYAYSELL